MDRYVNAELRRFVAERARNTCEYCQIAEEDSYFRHQIEHIISLKHGGTSEPENLALSCVFCNRNKGSDIATVGSASNLIRFFNPRTDKWNDHFELREVVIVPLTDIGEATIRILRMNDEARLVEREVLTR